MTLRIHNLFLFISILALGACDTTSPETYCDEARKYSDKHDYKKSIELLSKAIAKDENCIRAYLNRGVDESALNDHKSAIEDYNILLKKSPKNTLALLDRAISKGQLKDYQGAISDFNDAINTKGGEKIYLDLNPNGPVDATYDCSMEEIRLERGIVYYLAGDLRKSFEDTRF